MRFSRLSGTGRLISIHTLQLLCLVNDLVLQKVCYLDDFQFLFSHCTFPH